MRGFFAYFFGVGSEQEFYLFSFAHFAPILLLFAALFLLYRYRDVIKNSRYETNFRYTIAFILIICDMSYYWRFTALPQLSGGVVESLPIGVCAWSVIFCSFMIVGKSQRLFDVVYFWLLTGSLFALITPTPLTYCGPTRYRYYQFWCEHLFGYVAVFYMMFVHKMRPTWKSFLRAYVLIAVLAMIAFFTNMVLGPGANYLFMAAPESTPSILDILPPNHALRVFVMAAAISLMFFLSYLPWLIMDKRKAKVSA